MAVNKVILDGEILVDLTGDTATEADVAAGKLFHLPDGTPAAGTGTGGEGGSGEGKYFSYTVIGYPAIGSKTFLEHAQYIARLAFGVPAPQAEITAADASV